MCLVFYPLSTKLLLQGIFEEANLLLQQNLELKKAIEKTECEIQKIHEDVEDILPRIYSKIP